MSPDHTRAVIRAVHELGDRGLPPTISDVAAYLKIGEEDARACLLKLRQQRIFVDRTRRGARRWFPWREVN